MELYSLISDEEILFGEETGMCAELLSGGDGRQPATSKACLLIRGVRFAAKANTEGSLAASAAHGVGALVSVTLGQRIRVLFPGASLWVV